MFGRVLNTTPLRYEHFNTSILFQSNKSMLNPSHPDTGRIEKKLTENFIFTLCGASRP